MDASYKIQRGIHVHLIQLFMCPEFWVHIIGIPLRFLQYLLVIRGHLWYTEEEDPEDFCPAQAKDCVCSLACLPTEKIVKFCA